MLCVCMGSANNREPIALTTPLLRCQISKVIRGLTMPLPCISKGWAKRCRARCKRTLKPCQNLAAYGLSVCRVHGSRRPETVKRGLQHPAYKHGQSTLKARAEYSAASARLRELEAMMHLLGMTTANRWPGRKPKEQT